MNFLRADQFAGKVEDKMCGTLASGARHRSVTRRGGLKRSGAARCNCRAAAEPLEVLKRKRKERLDAVAPLRAEIAELRALNAATAALHRVTGARQRAGGVEK